MHITFFLRRRILGEGFSVKSINHSIKQHAFSSFTSMFHSIVLNAVSYHGVSKVDTQKRTVRSEKKGSFLYTFNYLHGEMEWNASLYQKYLAFFPISKPHMCNLSVYRIRK